MVENHRMAARDSLVRSALFVDFDNIYSGLREIDLRAAERFATNPQAWVDWMMVGMPLPEGRDEAARERSILIRRCYLNPERFQRHRSDFTRAGFEVVDCPPLTRQGKTSTDIRMVMDILDTLTHETYFGEFILLSSDADFTPVLLRLRSMDRRTLVLTVGPAARAYRSACEQVIDEVYFIESGLGVSAPELPAERAMLGEAPAPTDADLLRRMADRLFIEASERPGGEMLAADVPPVYKRFPEFTSQSDWLGFFGLRPLTAHLTTLRPELRIVDEPDSAWKWKLVLEALPGTGAGAPAAPTHDDLRARIAELVLEIVREASRPTDLASAANLVQQQLGPLVRESSWAGAGSFTALLRRLDLPGVAIEPPSASGPGLIYDPQRFQPPQTRTHDAFEQEFPALAMVSTRVSQITGTPRLTPPEYGSVFRAMETELAQSTFNLTLTSKAMRDRCAEEGHSVSRSDVVFILRGIQFSGYRLAARPEQPRAGDLAAAFARNVVVLCREAQMELSEEEQELVRRWITGHGAADNGSAATLNGDREQPVASAAVETSKRVTPIAIAPIPDKPADRT
jgi:hypothetical protein